MLKEDKLNLYVNVESCMKMKAGVFRTSMTLKLGGLNFICVTFLKEAKSIMRGT